MGNINIEIPDEVHKKVKAFCALKGTTLKEFIIKSLDERLNKDKIKNAV